MSAAPKLEPVRLCRDCECEAAPDSLDCIACEAKRAREIFAREHRIASSGDERGVTDHELDRKDGHWWAIGRGQ